MKYNKLGIICLIFVLLVANCSIFKAQKFAMKNPAENVSLPALFSDHMVLQRDKPITLWGKADAESDLLVTFKEQMKMIRTDVNGYWRTDLEPEPAGGPYELAVIGVDTLKFSDVMVGEVWIASGQSNMQMRVDQVKHAEQEIANAMYPNMRLYTVDQRISFSPLNDVDSDGWHRCSPQTVGGFSATAFFFGRDIYESLDIPVGLIHTSWGGTPAEAWTSESGLAGYPDYLEMIEENKSISTDPESLKVMYNRMSVAYDEAMEEWIQYVTENDMGMNDLPWYHTNYDASDWKKMKIPGVWEGSDVGKYDGIVWYRNEFKLPESWMTDSISIELGAIDDMDYTYLNGELIGETDVYNTKRVYRVARERLKSGINEIVVRVIDYTGSGGFWGQPEELKIVSDQGESISLAGMWRYKVAIDLADIPSKAKMPRRPQYLPSVLYNAMIHPLIPFSFRGAIWYQGESNAGRAYEYRSLFPNMIKDWRAKWDQGNFPFYFVQLANYKPVSKFPAESEWAELREAQLMTLSLDNTGMAVIIDIGEANDIHPKNKQDVGKRLALIARHHDYNEDVIYSGPLYKSHEIEKDKVRLYFDHIGGGLVAKGGVALKGFSIAGSDRKFYWADARIEGETVLVSSSKVSNPLAVRYAWADNPVCNFYNEADLPASPFRTDNWPGITQPKE